MVNDANTVVNPDAPWHGTPGGYANHSCRCLRCTKAWAVKHREGNRKRQQKAPVEIPHGTINGYTNYGCRCPRCKEAARIQMRNYRAQANEQR